MITYDSTHYQHLTFDASAVKQPWSNFECSVAVDYFALKQELQQASLAQDYNRAVADVLLAPHNALVSNVLGDHYALRVQRLS